MTSIQNLRYMPESITYNDNDTASAFHHSSLSHQFSIKNKTLRDTIYFWNLVDLHQDM